MGITQVTMSLGQCLVSTFKDPCSFSSCWQRSRGSSVTSRKIRISGSSSSLLPKRPPNRPAMAGLLWRGVLLCRWRAPGRNGTGRSWRKRLAISGGPFTTSIISNMEQQQQAQHAPTCPAALFDPTTIGLRAGFILTDFSKLKG